DRLCDLGLDAAGVLELAQQLAERLPDANVTLDSTLADLAGHVERPDTDADAHFLTDLTYTLQVGRTPLASRLAIIVGSTAELRAGLERFLQGIAGGDTVFWSPGPDPVPDLPDVVATFRCGDLAQVAAF